MASIMGEAPETESEEEIDTENPQKEKVIVILHNCVSCVQLIMILM